MLNRRQLLQVIGATAATSFVSPPLLAEKKQRQPPAYIYCLNMATIRGHKLGFIKELEVAASAGFKAVEIWVESLQTYLSQGGSLPDAKKRIRDLGMQIENAIGFAAWIVEDETARRKGLEQMKKEMDMLAQIGCKRTAAPPIGATDMPLLDLRKVAERYRAVLEIGDQTGVVPHLEMWGFSKNLSRVSEVTFAAMETGHPAARVLLDIFHLFKGGSSIDTLPLIRPSAVEILHMNDYTADRQPASITDPDRIYPGDGVAPIKRILEILQHKEKPLVISVEVFNKNYYTQDPTLVARTALAKMKSITTGTRVS
jgi:sugar phosphate isomerase/epimerase